MAKTNARKLFVNETVRDLPRSKAFFETLGCGPE
jgi:predicted lactoylglutathione lyase